MILLKNLLIRSYLDKDNLCFFFICEQLVVLMMDENLFAMARVLLTILKQIDMKANAFTCDTKVIKHRIMRLQTHFVATYFIHSSMIVQKKVIFLKHLFE